MTDISQDSQNPRSDDVIASIDGGDLDRPMSLVVAHPGHELLAFGWMLVFTPSVHVVTDGSGRDAVPRIEATARLLEGGLGEPGALFGRWADAELYDALFAGRFEPFLDLRDQLAEAWCFDGVRTVICDAYERIILMHDVVQLIACAAVDVARERGADIELLELPNHLGPGDQRPGNPRLRAALKLTGKALKKKIGAARAYESDVIQREAEEFIRLRGEEAFGIESLFHAHPRTRRLLEEEPRPAWEDHGERLMLEGVYDHVIRLRENVIPLVEAL